MQDEEGNIFLVLIQVFSNRVTSAQGACSALCGIIFSQ